MAPMGVSPPIGRTNHGRDQALGLLCARCGGLVISLCTEVVPSSPLTDLRCSRIYEDLRSDSALRRTRWLQLGCSSVAARRSSRMTCNMSMFHGHAHVHVRAHSVHRRLADHEVSLRLERATATGLRKGRAMWLSVYLVNAASAGRCADGARPTKRRAGRSDVQLANRRQTW